MWKKGMVPFLLLSFALPAAAINWTFYGNGSNGKITYSHSKQVVMKQEAEGSWIGKQKAVHPDSNGKVQLTKDGAAINRARYTSQSKESKNQLLG